MSRVRTVAEYLSRLMDIHIRHSGLGRPTEGWQENNVIEPWEVHLRDRFLLVLRSDIQQHVKTHCVDYDKGRLQAVCMRRKSSEREKRRRRKRWIPDCKWLS